MKELRDLLKRGERVEGRWLILEKLGSGGFGQVYSAKDEEKRREVAVKVEPKGKKEALQWESKVMEELGARAHVPVYYGFGSNSAINYLVMEVLGKNLSDLRRESPNDRCCFSRRTALAVAIQTLEAIEDFHMAGFVHRDIKPGNFVMGKPGTSRCSVVIIIDYGLARTLYDKNGNLVPARAQSGFRGTVKYASPAAHTGEDLGRKDDLWSHFYMTLEMSRGTLPWRRLKDKVETGRAKRMVPMETLCEGLPAALIRYGTTLQGLKFESDPPYGEVRALLEDLLKAALPAVHRVKAVGPLYRSFALDWEEGWATAKSEDKESTTSGVHRIPSAPGVTLTGAATGKTSLAAGSQLSLPGVPGFISPAHTPSAVPAKKDSARKVRSGRLPLSSPRKPSKTHL